MAAGVAKQPGSAEGASTGDPVNERRSRGSGWPFAVGDRVRALDNWGPLVCNLSIRAHDHPHAEYTVHEVADGGRWLALRDDDGCVYSGGGMGPCYGPTYFEEVAARSLADTSAVPGHNQDSSKVGSSTGLSSPGGES